MVHAANNCSVFLGFTQTNFKAVAILFHFMSNEFSVMKLLLSVRLNVQLASKYLINV